MTAEAARDAALKCWAGGTSTKAPQCIVLVNDNGIQRLVWLVQVDLDAGTHAIVAVDAVTGRVLEK